MHTLETHDDWCRDCGCFSFCPRVGRKVSSIAFVMRSINRNRCRRGAECLLSQLLSMASIGRHVLAEPAGVRARVSTHYSQVGTLRMYALTCPRFEPFDGVCCAPTQATNSAGCKLHYMYTAAVCARGSMPLLHNLQPRVCSGDTRKTTAPVANESSQANGNAFDMSRLLDADSSSDSAPRVSACLNRC